ncbi:hypothetical protein V8C86DRAFT_2530632 [Haematococcus lacustris]
MPDCMAAVLLLVLVWMAVGAWVEVALEEVRKARWGRGKKGREAGTGRVVVALLLVRGWVRFSWLWYRVRGEGCMRGGWLLNVSREGVAKRESGLDVWEKCRAWGGLAER